MSAATDLPVLRAPPFPWADAGVSTGAPADRAPDDLCALFAQVRDARVGGSFWAPPAEIAPAGRWLLRPRAAADHVADEDAIACPGELDPWSILPDAAGLIAHGDDEWVPLARINDLPVRLLSSGRFGTIGDSDAALDRRAGEALTAAAWRDPFTGGPSTLPQVVELLALWRRTFDANRAIAVASGMAWWKRPEMRRFLWHPSRPLYMARRAGKALSLAERAGGGLAIWPSRVSSRLIVGAKTRGVPLVRVEDGFVRSVGLGVDLVPPSSVVVDFSGIHFDPHGPSDLESILEQAAMPPALLARAVRLRERIVAAGISKYAVDGAPQPAPERAPGRRLVLVPGQVGNDMSVRAAAGDLLAAENVNAELLRRVRAVEPDAEIWFRPHPDVDSGLRQGAVADEEVLRHADRIVRGGGMAPLLDTVDAVHTLTSLTGFEALMRGVAVTCHGTPFYAGWGLTRDLASAPTRRMRRLRLDELVAGVLILYPRYLDPVTGLPCPPEVLVGRMAGTRTRGRLDWIGPLRRWQGRMLGVVR
ncbi:capsule biosynthesis protein [Croceibacterium mercuriale]|uniref:Capsule biosynthesis protein n=1 Tax=Croceibacterium mercuriale TaxID=1572751 RepID=A0A0B2BVD3_9SPHN|nr:capsule biosynthesis protein [Croceibacterium mercuriale]KHL25399.1 capsule biosynthesis protein [Croceibacterium mercuriale]